MRCRLFTKLKKKKLVEEEESKSRRRRIRYKYKFTVNKEVELLNWKNQLFYLWVVLDWLYFFYIVLFLYCCVFNNIHIMYFFRISKIVLK